MLINIKYLKTILIGIAHLIPATLYPRPIETWKNDSTIQQVCGEKNLVLCVTIPKVGSHLLVKCLTLLGIEGIEYEYNAPLTEEIRVEKPYRPFSVHKYANEAFFNLLERIKKQRTRRSFLVHLPYESKFESFFFNCTTTNFLMIRDPRDQLISIAATSLKDPKNREVYIRKALLDLLSGGQIQTPWAWRHRACDVVWSVGIVKFYRSFLQWAKNKQFTLIRFENLVGPRGGGTLEAQIDEVKKIVQHLNVTITDNKMLDVISNLYGDTLTFQKGQSQGWKHYFTPRIKKAFKKVPGACKLLIELGYERNCNW